MKSIEQERAILLTLPFALEAMFLVAYGTELHICGDYEAEECPHCKESCLCNESLVHAENCKTILMAVKLESLGFSNKDYDIYVRGK